MTMGAIPPALSSDAISVTRRGLSALRWSMHNSLRMPCRLHLVRSTILQWYAWH